MQKVKFTRSTLPHEWSEIIVEGEVRELPDDQVKRWLKRSAIVPVQEPKTDKKSKTKES